VVLAEAVIKDGLEDLHLLPRDLHPTETADQLLALSAEHAARNHLYPAVFRRFPHDVHVLVFVL
jgi:hypothetical protein